MGDKFETFEFQSFNQSEFYFSMRDTFIFNKRVDFNSISNELILRDDIIDLLMEYMMYTIEICHEWSQNTTAYIINASEYARDGMALPLEQLRDWLKSIHSDMMIGARINIAILKRDLKNRRYKILNERWKIVKQWLNECEKLTSIRNQLVIANNVYKIKFQKD